jgi:hypothetical protein
MPPTAMLPWSSRGSVCLPAQVLKLSDAEVALPLSSCPDQCNKLGACLGALRPDDKRSPWCRCHKGFTGPTCNDTIIGLWDNNCYNNCTGGSLAAGAVQYYTRWT